MKRTSSTKTQKKPKKVTPTPKQRLAAKLVLENTGKGEPIGKVLKQAGYSDGIAKNPSDVTEATGFKLALIQAGATEEKLAQVFNSGLEANRVDVIKGISQASDVPDIALRVATAEKVAKIYGLTAEKQQSGNTYNTFIQSNTINPNEAGTRSLVDQTLDMLMEQTKRPID